MRLLPDPRGATTVPIRRPEGYYRSFDIRAAHSPRWRHIDAPIGRLRAMLDWIHRELLASIELPLTLFGGARGRSFVDHARYHARQPVVVSLDLRTFFPSITGDQVRTALRRQGFDGRSADRITSLATLRGRLPEGAPTSPMLANLAVLPLHDALQDICSESGVRCSFYVDDMAFSGARATEILGRVQREVRRQGFWIAWKKRRIMRASEPQLVCGLNVNRGVAVPADRIRELQRMIRGLTRTPDERLAGYVRGYLEYVRMASQAQYQRLLAYATARLPEDMLTNPGSVGEGTVAHVVERRTCAGRGQGCLAP